ncbi:MAG: M23 family metallopeptidase [Nannocystis sp.]|nr:M23 family metallopeptidase [Nannocystis sp.]
MSKKGNRRMPAGKPRARTRSKRAPRVKVDPAERKIRNRTALFLGLLMAVNAYVFLGRDIGLDALGVPRAAVIGGAAGATLGTYADPPARSCTADPARIFAGLDRLLFQQTTLEGRAFAEALALLGVRSDEIDALAAAIRPSLDLGLIAERGAPVRVASDRHGAVHALELEIAEGQLLQACRSGGGFQIRTLHHAAALDVATIEIEIGRDADLLAAIAAAGESPELAQVIAEALAYELDLQTELRAGDQLRLVVEKRLIGDAFHRYGDVLGIRYRGDAGKHTALRYGGAYYTPEGQPVARALRRTPLAYHPLPTEARGLLSPTLEVISGRPGAMYRRPEGAPVIALADGVIRSAQADGDAGLTLEIVHHGGLVTRYSHLSRLLASPSPGVAVRSGQLVALAGHSGKTAGDRVRLELWSEEDGEVKQLDPLILQANGDARPQRLGVALEGPALSRFQSDTAALRRTLR